MPIRLILDGKSLNAKIYLKVFEVFAGVELKDYMPYRKLVLLLKDLRDFKSDLENGDISVSTIAFLHAKKSSTDVESTILAVAESIYEMIADSILKKRAYEVLSEIKIEISKFYRELDSVLKYEFEPRLLNNKQNLAKF